jgi:hypothetical protein
VSTWFPEPVRCPHCGHEQQARLAHGVHAVRAPEVRDQIFARTFHAITCTACHETFVAQRPLVYTDTERKHWVHVALADHRPRWPELEDQTTEVYNRAFTGSPLAREVAERMKVRLVFGLDELREKLVLWAANLDDRAIECLKVELIRNDPALARASLIVDSVAPDHALTIVVDRERTLTVDGTLVDQFDTDQRLPARFPELFGGRYVSVHRLLGPRYRWAEP